MVDFNRLKVGDKVSIIKNQDLSKTSFHRSFEGKIITVTSINPYGIKSKEFPSIFWHCYELDYAYLNLDIYLKSKKK